MRIGWIVIVTGLLGACRADDATTSIVTTSGDRVAPVGPTTSLADDEVVELFPSAAYLDGDAWVVPLHAWVYEPETGSRARTLALTAVALGLGVAGGDGASPVTRARLWPFVVDNEGGKVVVVELAGSRVVLPATSGSGHAELEARIPVSALPVPTRPAWVDARVALAAGDRRVFAGRVLLVPPTGTSVISDIDDTVKVTNVRDKAELVQNTFVRPLRVVDGMPEVLTRWAGAGAAVHYLSASPWQLHALLADFFAHVGLPTGVLDLKLVQLASPTVTALFDQPEVFKVPRLDALLRQFPGRRFVLVGDSGERDPEAYAEIVRRFPAQVAAVYIRDVTNEPLAAPRYAALLAGLDASRWQVFTDPTTLPITTP